MLSVEVLRGLASVAVVLYHAHIILLLPEYGHINAFEAIASRGWMGVNFFFVLSGFIILHAHKADIGRPATLPRYAWRRVVRIYPMYWIAASLYILGALAGIGYPDFAVNIVNIAWAYSLIGLFDPITLPLRVAWTLFYEMQFYILFAVLLVSRRWGMIALGTWFTAIILANLTGPFGNASFLHLWNVYFLIGMLVNFGISRLKGWQGAVALGVGIVGTVVLAGLRAKTLDGTRNDPVVLIALAVCFALVLLGAIVCERTWSWKPPKPLLLLGSASYSIYLFHSPVISVMAQLNAMFLGGRLPPLVLFWIIAVTSAAVGLVAHLVLERPLLKALRRFERHITQPKQASAAEVAK